MSQIKAELPRTANLNIRLTEPEIAAIRHAAANSYLSLSSWARRLLIAALSSDHVPAAQSTAEKPGR
jgi:plasmid stability protein